LASASTHDFYAALTGRRDTEHLLRVGRWMTLVWAVILVGGAMLFPDRRTPVVELALQVASLTYGGLLGTYLLGGFWPRARERDVIIAVLTGLVVMTPVVLGWPFRLFPGLAWPWDVPLGTAITMLVGIVSSLVGAPREYQATGQPATGGS
jgi:Na+/proline symporter